MFNIRKKYLKIKERKYLFLFLSVIPYEARWQRGPSVILIGGVQLRFYISIDILLDSLKFDLYCNTYISQLMLITQLLTFSKPS